MKKHLILLAGIFISTIVFSQELELELIADGFSSPLEIKHAGDDRLFIVEQGGQIKILNPDGSINPTPFLNISSLVSSGGERGLLGLAFHPDYTNNGFFYLNYTNTSGNTQISRFTVSGDPNITDENSELQMLSYNQPFTNHNGGHIAFGPDGKLYISSGDGGSGGDPQNNSQDLSTLLGKIVRLDVDLPAPYIPADNPFIGNPDALDEIWAFGVRNPWKFSFDTDSGDLWIADVGQNAWEEINKMPSVDAGLNYGWRCYEGTNPFNTADCPPVEELTFPIAEYASSGSRCSITGGYVYRGDEFPAIEGLYFFADLCSGEIGTVDQDDNLVFHGNFGAGTITSFGVDHQNNLYLAAFSGGSIYKVIDNTPLSLEDENTNSFNIVPNPAQNIVTINSTVQPISSINIIDLRGTILKKYKGEHNKTQAIDVSHLKTGVYFIAVTSNSGKVSYKKLMIQ